MAKKLESARWTPR